MSAETLDLIRLDESVLCESCQRISAAKNGHCPGCGSTAIAKLQPMLDRTRAVKARPTRSELGSELELIVWRVCCAVGDRPITASELLNVEIAVKNYLRKISTLG